MVVDTGSLDVMVRFVIYHRLAQLHEFIRCRKVHFTEAYCYARSSYPCAYHYIIRRARGKSISLHMTLWMKLVQIVGDDTSALDSVLKADVWRDHLLKEEASLNATLAELEKEGDDKRFEDAREEASSRLAEVHARLSDMDAESGPSRAATLLAGKQFS